MSNTSQLCISSAPCEMRPVGRKVRLLPVATSDPVCQSAHAKLHPEMSAMSSPLKQVVLIDPSQSVLIVEQDTKKDSSWPSPASGPNLPVALISETAVEAFSLQGPPQSEMFTSTWPAKHVMCTSPTNSVLICAQGRIHSNPCATKPVALGSPIQEALPLSKGHGSGMQAMVSTMRYPSAQLSVISPW